MSVWVYAYINREYACMHVHVFVVDLNYHYYCGNKKKTLGDNVLRVLVISVKQLSAYENMGWRHTIRTSTALRWFDIEIF
jgi:hypothetical protein